MLAGAAAMIALASVAGRWRFGRVGPSADGPRWVLHSVSIGRTTCKVAAEQTNDSSE